MSQIIGVPWSEVSSFTPTNGDLHQVLATVDALRTAWREALSSATPAEFEEARQRSLRRHAIETGIIEQLYDVDWGITEALVAEGLTAEVAAREGDLDHDALATIRSQFDALSLLAEAAREGHDLTVSFIRQLHTAICRTQSTYKATTAFGQIVELPLHHGAWKMQPNHVVREDGTLLEYVPPEHVQSEIERLLSLYYEASRAHPVELSAWIHHSFIRIHPFEDGNGRVARALSLLVLLRHDYAPLVVDRTSRADYIRTLDQANEGDLRGLIRLFARLEIVALRSELERPARPEADGTGALDVARSYVERLRSMRGTSDREKTVRTENFAGQMHEKILHYLQELGTGLRDQFREIDPGATSNAYSAAPPDEEARWWRAQIVRAARNADFFANLRDGTWWTNLRLSVLGQKLRYVAVLQKVGHGETGVLALTVFAEIVVPHDQSEAEDEPRQLPAQALRTTDAESATFVHSDDPDARWPEVCAVLDRTLAAALSKFADGLD